MRRAARVAAVGAMLGLTLHPLVRYQWSVSASIVGIAALGLGAAALWWAYAALAARCPSPRYEPPGSWSSLRRACSSCSRGTALLAQLASTVAVGLLVVTLVAPPSIGTSPRTRRRSPFLAPMLHALVLNGLFYAELGAPAALALALAPLAAARRPRAGAARSVSRVVAATLGVVLVLAPFVARGAIDYVADDRGYSEYE